LSIVQSFSRRVAAYLLTSSIELEVVVGDRSVGIPPLTGLTLVMLIVQSAHHRLLDHLVVLVLGAHSCGLQFHKSLLLAPLALVVLEATSCSLGRCLVEGCRTQQGCVGWVVALVGGN
jgi:hypothetical protein